MFKIKPKGTDESCEKFYYVYHVEHAGCALYFLVWDEVEREWTWLDSQYYEPVISIF